MALAAWRGRIAAITAAALFTLFAGQPLHGAAALAAGAPHAANSIAADPGVATPGSHHAHLCPLCRAANQTRFSMAATSTMALDAVAFLLFSIHAAPAELAHAIDLCASGPRAPPRPHPPLV